MLRAHLVHYFRPVSNDERGNYRLEDLPRALRSGRVRITAVDDSSVADILFDMGTAIDKTTTDKCVTPSVSERLNLDKHAGRIRDKLVVGTHNRKKCGELNLLLEPLGLHLVSLAECPAALSVEETGDTFIENARLKAVEQAQHLGEWTIGEDSGLCVPCLDGAPGVLSARYSDPGATDERNNTKLLNELAATGDKERRAYYVCTIVLADPDGEIFIEEEGRCWGRIINERRGEGGFGYDPLFEIPEYHQTFAELGTSVKSVLSHRARALSRFSRKLSSLMNAGG